MQPDTQTTKATSPGEWIVTTVGGQIVVVAWDENSTAPQKVIAIFGDEDAPDANEHIANAALLTISKPMLDALIAIQETLMTSKEILDLESINRMISEILAKLANEAGEEF